MKLINLTNQDSGTIVSMKLLSNKRQSFCRYIAIDGLTPTEAYLKSFNVSSDRRHTATEASSRLLKDSNIVATISSLKDTIENEIVSKVVWDKTKIIEELSINVELGRETKQLASSNQALKLIGSAVGNVFEPETQQINVTASILHKLPDSVLSQLENMAQESSYIEAGDIDTTAIDADYKIVDSEDI